MKIAVITYDHPHQKTQDLICRLVLSGYTCGYEEINLIVLPWEERKKYVPLYSHRPDNPIDITIEQLSARMGITYFRCGIDQLDEHFTNSQYDKILIAGAGILPSKVVKHFIINTHPGYLPYIRGLDALKWAILYGEPIGVTTYYIGEAADTGILIKRQFVPLYHTDTFHSIARRQYELEISMMVEALTDIPDGRFLEANLSHPLHTRMDHINELRMMDRLENMIQKL